MLHELDAPVIVINTHKTNRFSFSCLGYLENLHVKGDKVILVHCPEYKSLINSRKWRERERERERERGGREGGEALHLHTHCSVIVQCMYNLFEMKKISMPFQIFQVVLFKAISNSHVYSRPTQYSS